VFSPFRKKELLAKMTRLGMICLIYQIDPTGSEEAAAGLCDPSGRIFGVMPHPEAFIRWTQHPEWAIAPGRANSPGQGIAIFDNAYQEALRVIAEPTV
jgi:phosphoribosylformylglycinamidine synthase